MNNPIIETLPGRWLLLTGSRSLRTTMLTLIARLAERGPVRVLDGGNQFNVYLVSRPLQGRKDLLERISISRAFTCYQLLASLERATTHPSPYIVLDLLSTFFDENVPFSERRRLLEYCLPQLDRLSASAGGAVSVHPPAIMSPQAEALFAILHAAAPESWFQELPTQAVEPWRLF
jgi:hypothetical protein